MLEFLVDFLNENCISYKRRADIKGISSIRIGGIAEIVVYPGSMEELILIIDRLDSIKFPFVVIGNSTNILFVQEVVSIALISTVRLKNVCVIGKRIKALCGDTISSISRIAASNGLAGIEQMSGIPGTLGGAISGNAGAFGRSISDVVLKVSVYNRISKAVEVLYNAECCFAYRKSVFSCKKYIILSAELQLESADRKLIDSNQKSYDEKRRKTQPISIPSLGSVFKRPANGFAGEMIESCGLKGYTIGGAMISDVHAGFIVNSNKASVRDFLSLYYLSRKSVFEKFSVLLEPEIKFV